MNDTTTEEAASVFGGNECLSHSISDFAASIKAISKSQPLTMSILAATHLGLKKRHMEFVRSQCEVIEESDEQLRVHVPSGLLHRSMRERDELESLSRALQILPPTYIVALVSQLDFFLGKLLRWMFVAKPEMLNSSERTLTLAQLSSFKSIDDARESIIEKEVETFLRKSHRDQFKWLEERLGVPLTKDLPNWPTFIELTERRNLFVHANGRVSEHYLQTGLTTGYSVEGLEVGNDLQVDQEYFTRAFRCVYEIGIKLAHVIWRKLAPTDTEKADGGLLELQYNLLLSREYVLAELLGEFYRKCVRRKHSDEIRRMILVNEAIALDRQNKADDCLQLLKQEDWSSTSAKFKLAVAVLERRTADVLALMDIIGVNGEIDKNDYCNWPLFGRMRDEMEFLQKYEDLFGEKLEVSEAFKKIEDKQDNPQTMRLTEGSETFANEIAAIADKGMNGE